MDKGHLYLLDRKKSKLYLIDCSTCVEQNFFELYDKTQDGNWLLLEPVEGSVYAYENGNLHNIFEGTIDKYHREINGRTEAMWYKENKQMDISSFSIDPSVELPRLYLERDTVFASEDCYIWDSRMSKFVLHLRDERGDNIFDEEHNLRQTYIDSEDNKQEILNYIYQYKVLILQELTEAFTVENNILYQLS